MPSNTFNYSRQQVPTRALSEYDYYNYYVFIKYVYVCIMCSVQVNRNFLYTSEYFANDPPPQTHSYCCLSTLELLIMLDYTLSESASPLRLELVTLDDWSATSPKSIMIKQGWFYNCHWNSHLACSFISSLVIFLHKKWLCTKWTTSRYLLDMKNPDGK